MAYIDYINDEMEKIISLINNEKEKELAELIQKYNFIVGSMELKMKLERVLPTGTNVAYSLFVDSTKIYAVKKFDVNDFFIKIESEERYDNNEIYTGAI